MINNPIFIISNPRSGSSVFRMVLNNSDDSIFPPECGFIQWLYDKYKNWSNVKISEFVSDVLNSKKMEGWYLDKDGLYNHIEKNNPKNYGEACFYVYQYYGKKLNKNIKVWGDKNNYYIDYLDTLKDIYPNAKFIWLHRDPRDVCSSYLKLDDLSDEIKYKPKVPKDIKNIFSNLKNNQNKIYNFFNEVDNDKKFIISFEDFITQNPKSIKDLGLFTELDIITSINNFNKKKYFDEPTITISWKKKIKENLDGKYLKTYTNHKFSEKIEEEYKKIKWDINVY
tara:strand:+ start:879 stop:1724 length:846 start_codon:yes stop_codon:yes gene_type:complete